MILFIDNYDSFTYNLVQYVGELTRDIRVVRNDKLSVRDALELRPSHVILSPGPGYPKDAGICVELIRAAAGTVPILGVCLGHQAIGEAFGARIAPAPRLMHGKADTVALDTDCPLFAGLERRETVGRYHSLAIERASLPDALVERAVSDDGCIMAVSHRDYPIYGIQFHPESVLTPCGKRIIQNFLAISPHETACHEN